ncbi:MAG: AmmeMemoRadiSam system protein B [Anaerolineae bacterium]
MADIRPPAVAGMFYPADPKELKLTIQEYLEAADPPELSSVRSVIVPHAGYVYSGPVAAYAYKLLAAQSERPRRILVMGPSHRAWFPGVAVADVDGFRTPIGTQPVDREFVGALTDDRSIFSAVTSPHTPEHCLEVQYPFIQTVLPDVPTVPMLFGEVDPIEVGEALDEVLQPGDLVLVSSDLSHYHANEQAHRLDRSFLDALLEDDKQGVARGEACGRAPVLALMIIAERRNWHPHLLDYRTSGDTSGNRSQVVGYAAVAYTEES